MHPHDSINSASPQAQTFPPHFSAPLSGLPLASTTLVAPVRPLLSISGSVAQATLLQIHKELARHQHRGGRHLPDPLTPTADTSLSPRLCFPL